MHKALGDLIRTTSHGKASRAADLRLFDAGGTLKRLRRLAGVRLFHHSAPDRTSAIGPGNLLHRAVIGVADPHANDQFRRVAHGPAVFVIIGGAGFDRSRSIIAQTHHAVGAKHRRARGVVAQNIADQIGNRLAFGAEHLGTFGRGVGIQHFAMIGGHAQDRDSWPRIALIGEGGISRCQIQQLDFTRAQRHRQTVCVALLQRRDAHAMRQIQKRIDPGELQRLDRRDIERIGQCEPQTLRPMERVVVVHGLVAVNIQRHVPDHR